MGKIFYAKSANGFHARITNRVHCDNVSKLAGNFGREIGRLEESSTGGRFHDFGKNGDTFDGVLNGDNQNVDHAFPGAAFLFNYLKLYGKHGTMKWKKYEPMIESIAGHHDGLLSLHSMEDALRGTYEDDDADCCPSRKTPSLRGRTEFEIAKKAFREDFPDFRFPELAARDYENEVENMLDTRMLFSCLVDADYSVSASDDDPEYLTKNSRPLLDIEAAIKALEAHRAKIIENSSADKTLNQIRNSVYEACGRGDHAPGLFTLTAPTGVGKTLAMLNFALNHCKRNSMRRIIVVLPFLTLAEQTEREYRNIFKDILVDHSQKNLSEELRELAARWDAPVVITTSVRFFESLFSDRPTDCRKLHSIAESVILFDESQSLPADLAPATIKAVNALCKKYRCSMVFSTATQPDFSSLQDTEWKPVEILPDNKLLFLKMRRVKVEWRLYKNADIRKNPKLSDIASEMAQYENVCAIVNLRSHARELFEELRGLCGDDGLFLLTTDLCPAHRIQVVEKIKARQAAHKPCHVVATQCIEAGVDLDFDVMFRSLAPLESIIQAAGRCNRNGRIKYGRVIIFEPDVEGRLYPGDSYERAAMIVKNLWADDPELDISDPELIREYYHILFVANKANEALEKAIEDKDYPEVAKEYRLIRNSGVQLIVPWKGKIDLFNKIKDAGKIDRALLHEAAPITISCFDEDDVRKIATPIKLGEYKKERETGYYIMNIGFYDRYDEKMGFKPESGNIDNFYMF